MEHGTETMKSRQYNRFWGAILIVGIIAIPGAQLIPQWISNMRAIDGFQRTRAKRFRIEGHPVPYMVQISERRGEHVSVEKYFPIGYHYGIIVDHPDGSRWFAVWPDVKRPGPLLPGMEPGGFILKDSPPAQTGWLYQALYGSR